MKNIAIKNFKLSENYTHHHSSTDIAEAFSRGFGQLCALLEYMIRSNPFLRIHIN